MSTAADRPLTYEEERGKPMPSLNHAVIEMNLGFEFKKAGEFRIVAELSLNLNSRFLTPDLSVYPPTVVDFQRDIIRQTEPPLLVVEILSATQGYAEVMEKVAYYLENGVKSCWMIVPPTESITIFRPDGSQKTFTEGIAIDPAIGLTADLAAVFS